MQDESKRLREECLVTQDDAQGKNKRLRMESVILDGIHWKFPKGSRVEINNNPFLEPGESRTGTWRITFQENPLCLHVNKLCIANASDFVRAKIDWDSDENSTEAPHWVSVHDVCWLLTFVVTGNAGRYEGPDARVLWWLADFWGVESVKNWMVQHCVYEGGAYPAFETAIRSCHLALLTRSLEEYGLSEMYLEERACPDDIPSAVQAIISEHMGGTSFSRACRVEKLFVFLLDHFVFYGQDLSASDKVSLLHKLPLQWISAHRLETAKNLGFISAEQAFKALMHHQHVHDLPARYGTVEQIVRTSTGSFTPISCLQQTPRGEWVGAIEGKVVWVDMGKYSEPVCHKQTAKLLKDDRNDPITGLCVRNASDGKSLEFFTCSAQLKFVRVFNEKGKDLRSFNVDVDSPHGLIVDGEHLWVGDNENHEICVVSADDGKQIKRIPIPQQTKKHFKMIGSSSTTFVQKMCRNKHRVFVLTNGSSCFNPDAEILALDPLDGTVKHSVGVRGALNMSIGPEGSLIFCTSRAATICTPFGVPLNLHAPFYFIPNDSLGACSAAWVHHGQLCMAGFSGSTYTPFGFFKTPFEPLLTGLEARVDPHGEPKYQDNARVILDG